MDRQIHRRRLQLQGFSEGEINMALSRVELYADYNREHPGFFDAFISTSRSTILSRRRRRKNETLSLFLSLQIALRMVMSNCAIWWSVISAWRMIDSMLHDQIHPMKSKDSMTSIFNAQVGSIESHSLSFSLITFVRFDRFVSAIDQCDRLSKFFASVRWNADKSWYRWNQSEYSIEIRWFCSTSDDVHRIFPSCISEISHQRSVRCETNERPKSTSSAYGKNSAITSESSK